MFCSLWKSNIFLDLYFYFSSSLSLSGRGGLLLVEQWFLEFGLNSNSALFLFASLFLSLGNFQVITGSEDGTTRIWGMSFFLVIGS